MVRRPWAMLWLMVTWPALLRAEDAGEARDARALISRGIELRKQGDDRGALAAFEQAFALDQSPHALAQRALAEQALGLWVDAHEHLEEALRHTSDPWISEHGATLGAALSEIASRLGSLEVTCNVPNAEIQLDGRILGRTPLSRPVRAIAGQGVLQVSAKGYFDVSRHVQIDARSLARVDITLIPIPTQGTTPLGPNGAHGQRRGDRTDASSQAPPRAEPGPGARDALLYTSLGLTALGVAVGVTGVVMREVNIGLYNDDSRCDVELGVRRSEECPDEAAAWQLGEKLAIGGFAAAGVFGATAISLWLAWPKADPKQGVACVIAPSTLTCQGRF